MVSHTEYTKWLGRPIDLKTRFQSMCHIMNDIRDILNGDKSDGEKIKLIKEQTDFEYKLHKVHYDFFDVSDLISMKEQNDTN